MRDLICPHAEYGPSHIDNLQRKNNTFLDAHILFESEALQSDIIVGVICELIYLFILNCINSRS